MAESGRADVISRGHEPDTTNAPRIVVIVVALVLAVAVALLVSWYARDWVAGVPAADLGAAPRAPGADALPAPLAERAAPPPDFSHARHWVRGGEFLERRRAHERRLSTYGWVDREAGLIHVPVQRALELLRAEGVRLTPLAELEPR